MEVVELYGDYRDLNYVYDSGTLAEKQVEKLKKSWDMFVNGNLLLSKTNEGRVDKKDFTKIYIEHFVFPEHAYTTYHLVAGDGQDSFIYHDYCRSSENQFVDENNKVVVLEKTWSKNKEPMPLEIVRNKEMLHYDKYNDNASVEKWRKKKMMKWFY